MWKTSKDIVNEYTKLPKYWNREISIVGDEVLNIFADVSTQAFGTIAFVTSSLGTKFVFARARAAL